MPRTPIELSNRLIDFAVTASRIAVQCSKSDLGNHCSLQLTRCCTAPAAQYAEAIDAESRRDFIHKMKVALKELRETMVWLRIAQKMDLSDPGQLQSTMAECDELTAIFVTSVATARRNAHVDARR